MHRTQIAMAVVLTALVAVAAPLIAQSPSTVHELGIKYVRDSEEYAALTRQVYRLATDAVRRAAPASSQRWAVVMDIDETALDNSTYELERVSYGLPFEALSWNAWVLRRAAPPIPGVVSFVAAVRQSGGHLAWISDRDTVTLDTTRDNLRAADLWNDDDRLCLQDNPQRTKGARRAEVADGTGACGWAAAPTKVIAFVGDQMGDFPRAGEAAPDAGTDAAFGRTWFLLPNPMYGQWTTRVTRVSSSGK